MEMWGDAEGAYSIKESDSLSASLKQITGPAHIPYNDKRWSELLLHYEKLVHLHNLGLAAPSSSAEEEGQDVVGNACRQCAKYSPISSNLAAFCLHVARMIRDLQSSLESFSGTNDVAGEKNGSSPSPIKQRISLIGKARVTCGAINLLRILSHETIVQACCSKPETTGESESKSSSTLYPENNQQPDLENDANYILEESFMYRNRGEAGGQEIRRDAAMEIVASIMTFLSSIGRTIQHGKDSEIMAIPEMYDVIVQVFSLLLVFLSTQLYQPMASSAELAAEGRPGNNFFLAKCMEYSSWQRASQQQNSQEERMRQQQSQSLGQESAGEQDTPHNETLLFLYSCLHWLVDRPSPPRRSISAHYVDLPKSIAKQMSNMPIAPDGMYESHSIVMASAPTSENKASSTVASVRSPTQLSDPSKGSLANDQSSVQQASTSIALGTDDSVDISSPGHVSDDITSWNAPSNMLLHPIRSILLLSSTFFLLPIRLVRLAFNLLGHNRYRALMGGSNMKNLSDGDQVLLQQLQAHCDKKTGWNKTNNILWLTDSPVADLGASLILILSNNNRSQDSLGGSASQNPFRAELASLNDIRWVKENQSTTANSLFPSSPKHDDRMSALSLNFEELFEAFGRVVHTEVGALLLYTLLLSSPTFAESVAARSDLDTLVMPLLRSLYFSTTMAHVDPKSKPKSGNLSQLITLTPDNRPFRSQSQLYVILILLLIFSQDPSFGRDSFRRVHVSTMALKWVKERKIKEASLGSMILLVLLRAITFNLNRLQDGFLLSNCCAVLLNLSPHVTDLNDYIANRLVSVTTSCVKIYTTLVAQNGGEPEVEGDLSSPLGMHGETCRALLTVIKHSIRRKCLEKNIHLVYALLLEQRDFQKAFSFASFGDMSSISALIKKANSIIEDNGAGTSADTTLSVLKTHVMELKSYLAPDGFASDADSVASDASDLGNMTFTYEEETDPETFFVPYVWDCTVGTLTTTTMEWSRRYIHVFPLNEDSDMMDSALPQDDDTNRSASIDTFPLDNTPYVV